MRTLTPIELTTFEHDGLLLISDALNENTIAELIAVGDQLFSIGLQANRETFGEWDGLRNCIALDEAYLSLLTWPCTFPLVVQLLGSNIHLLSSQLIHLQPSPSLTSNRTQLGWHRDLFGSSRDLGHAQVPRLAIKIAYYLTDLTNHGGGMTRFVPGSHHWTQPLRLQPGQVDPPEAIELRVNAGDAVLFENRTWHADSPNHSALTRKCLMFQYGYRWLNPVDYISQSSELLRRGNDIQQQLLSGGKDWDASGRLRLGNGSAPLRKWCAEHRIMAGASPA